MIEKFKEIPIKKNIAYRGQFLEFHSDLVTLPDGATATREYLHHPGAIAAIPLLEDGRMVLVKQFRYATGEVLLEVPAGKMEPGENPEACVIRELAEEIGMRPLKLDHMLSYWSSPGFCDEVLHLYLARELTPAFGEKDPDEFIETITLSKAELARMLASGVIMDGKTAMALYILSAQNIW